MLKNELIFYINMKLGKFNYFSNLYPYFFQILTNHEFKNPDIS
jgi:hypothetical protein